MFGWLFLCAALCGQCQEIDESVDLIEFHHLYDEKGLPVLDQVIFYDWSDSQAKYLVRAWCLVDPHEILSRRPLESPHNRRVHVRWFDSDQKCHRHVSSACYVETWKQNDPERENKKLLAERLRVGLIQARKKDE